MRNQPPSNSSFRGATIEELRTAITYQGREGGYTQTFQQLCLPNVLVEVQDPAPNVRRDLKLADWNDFLSWIAGKIARHAEGQIELSPGHRENCVVVAKKLVAPIMHKDRNKFHRLCNTHARYAHYPKTGEEKVEKMRRGGLAALEFLKKVFRESEIGTDYILAAETKYRDGTTPTLPKTSPKTNPLKSLNHGRDMDEMLAEEERVAAQRSSVDWPEITNERPKPDRRKQRARDKPLTRSHSRLNRFDPGSGGYEE